MDSLTQIAIGMATASFVADRELKNKAMLYGAIIGTLPDLDVLFGALFYDPISALQLHRGFSHSLVFYILLAPLLGWCIQQLNPGKISLWTAIKMVFLTLLTHTLIDMFTSWGTQIFWPLPARVAIKSIFVIDVFYTLPWLFCLFKLYRSSGERRTYWLRTGFKITSCYLLVTLLVKLYILQVVDAQLEKQQVAVEEIMVKPTFSNVVLWNINVKTKNGYGIGAFSLLDTKPLKLQFYNQDQEVWNKYKGEAKIQQLMDLSEGWFLIEQNTAGTFFNDLRFGLLTDTQFAFSYIIKHTDTGVQILEAPKKPQDGKALLYKLMKRLVGN